MSSCVTVATATEFATTTVVSTSITSTPTTEVSTIPATFSLIPITSCAVAISTGGVCPTPVTTTSTETIPAVTSSITTQVPITLSFTSQTTVPTRTLFSTSCAAGVTSDPNTNSTTTTTSTTSSTTSQVASVITPPPTVVTSASQSVLPNGSSTMVLVTITSTPPPVTSYVTPGLNNSGGSSSGKASTNIGPIVGGALGGFFGLIAIVAAILCWRRSRQWDDIFEKDIGHGIGDDEDRRTVTPAPYHYGLVGHTTSPSMSPPNSPHLRPQMSEHSRVNSSASVYSRESQAPLTGSGGSQYPPVDANAAWSHGRRPSMQAESAFLSRPLQQAPSTPENLADRRHSTPPVASPPQSPRSPQGSGPFFVTNASPEQGTSERPLSAVADVTPGALKSPRTGRHDSQQPVIVHTDGGRVGPSPEPPAYSKS